MKEKLDLTPEEVVEYLKRNKPRDIVCGVVFILQFFLLFLCLRNWKTRGFFGKVFCFVLYSVLMVVFELLRWGDPFLKKYVSKEEQKSPLKTKSL